MGYECATLSRARLEQAIEQASHRPHGDVHKGRVILSPGVFTTPDRETNVAISRFAYFDCTANIHIGAWCMIGARARFYTHDHVHLGRKRPLLELQEQYGVLYQDKVIGEDVWIHDAARVLYQVTEIPDGVVVGAGAVLTKNPGPYEIWGGVPAKKIGERPDMDEGRIREAVRKTLAGTT
ncbi:MAG: acyltransferase [Desulfatibacillaceae bacterium]